MKDGGSGLFLQGRVSDMIRAGHCTNVFIKRWRSAREPAEQSPGAVDSKLLFKATNSSDLRYYQTRLL